MPIVHHQHVLVLPRPRLRSCRRPLHASPASGRYNLPRPVLERVLAKARALQNGEAVVALAAFIGRFQTGPRCLGRAFPLDRRVLADHPALDLSEARIRGGIKALLEVGFLEAEEAPPDRRFQRTVEGLQRRAILYRIAPAFAVLFAAANGRPRREPGTAVDGRRAVGAAPVPATASRPSRRPVEQRARSPKSTAQNPTFMPLGERSRELPRGSVILAEPCRDSGSSRLEEAIARLGQAIRGK